MSVPHWTFVCAKNLTQLRAFSSSKSKNFCRDGAVRPRPLELERLDALKHLVKRVIKLAMMGGAASQDRFEVGQVCDVDDLIDTLRERAHGVVCRKTMAEQNNEMFAPLRARAFDHLAQDRIRLESGALEVLVNHDHVVAVGLELEQHVFLKQTEVHFVSHVDELRHHDLLIL